MSYVDRCISEKYEAQKNIFKLALFTAFLPLKFYRVLSEDTTDFAPQFFEGHDFDIKNVEFGMQRMAWDLQRS